MAAAGIGADSEGRLLLGLLQVGALAGKSRVMGAGLLLMGVDVLRRWARFVDVGDGDGSRRRVVGGQGGARNWPMGAKGSVRRRCGNFGLAGAPIGRTVWLGLMLLLALLCVPRCVPRC